jgi:hypothetical protein
MTPTLPRLLPCAALVAAVLLAPACATRDSPRAKPLEGVDTATHPLSGCSHLTVATFAMPAGAERVEVGSSFAQGVAERLRSDFGATFASVEFAPAPRGLAGECLLQGSVTRYQPGSRALRAVPWLGGMVGGAKLDGTISVQDVASRQALLEATFAKRWRWSGLLGVAKGVDDMVAEAAARIANTVARAKGWQPSPAR